MSSSRIHIATVRERYQRQTHKRLGFQESLRLELLDQINFSGDVSAWEARWTFSSINGFTPAYGDIFAIANWDGTRSGTWDYLGQLVNSSVVVMPRYGSNGLELVTTGPGDANLDGRVTFADFQILQANFNGSGGWEAGDFNLDGQITFGDFEILQPNFNTVYFT